MFEELLQHSEDYIFLNIANQVLPTLQSKKCFSLQDRKKASKKKHWKPHENRLYADFLREHKDLFQKDREDKRLIKINILMSEYVKTKNSTQCRSHHQKMLLHYKTITNIILNLSSELEHQKQHKDMFADDFQASLYKSDDSNTNILSQRNFFDVINPNCLGYEDLSTPQQ